MRATVLPFAGSPLLQTQSVAEAQASAGQLLSDHRIKVGGGGFQATINGVSLGALSLYYMRYGTPLTVTSAPLEGFVAVLVPLRGSMRVEHEGFSFLAETGRSGAVISPGAPMRLDWSEDLEFFCFRIEVASLRAYLRSLEPEADPDEVIRFLPGLTAAAGRLSLLGSAGLIESATRRGQMTLRGSSPSALPARLSEQVMTALLVAQPRLSLRRSPTERAAPVSRQSVRRARELLESSQTLELSPSKLAAELGVSLRTLQIGFRDELGITPQAYLSEARMVRAHSELACASHEQGATVATIAARWGFSNVGRFAKKYQAAYSCQPVETLRQREGL